MCVDLSERVLSVKARKNWNRFAENYQLFRQESGTYNELVEIPAMLSLIDDVKDKKVLDAGCGYGYYSILLAKKGADVTGIDISEKMIDLAQKNAAESQVKCEFHVCDMQDLSMFNSNVFDLTISSIVIGNLDDLGNAFSEVSRVLKSKGIFIFSETHPILGATVDGWEKDSECNVFHANIDNYFERSIKNDKFGTRNGILIETNSRHRTIQDYFDALISSGFIVERLVEPEPIDNGKYLDIERYRKAKRIPIFIFFKARKMG